MTEINAIIERVASSAALSNITNIDDLVKWLNLQALDNVRLCKTITWYVSEHDGMMIGHALAEKKISSWYY